MERRVKVLCGILILAGGSGTAAGEQPGPLRFNRDKLTFTDGVVEGHVEPTGEMHGVVIDRLGDAPSPVVAGRAHLNLEHYLCEGKAGVHFPRKLKQDSQVSNDSVTISFPEQADWPVRAVMRYQFLPGGSIDVTVVFQFGADFKGFAVYYCSYFSEPYERFVYLGGSWRMPDLDTQAQLIIPKDERAIQQFRDGRYSFLGNRMRLYDRPYELPITASINRRDGWTIVQMVEPDQCSAIAPNRFASGHNHILGGWDVKKGEAQAVRIRYLWRKAVSPTFIEGEYERFLADLKKP